MRMTAAGLCIHIYIYIYIYKQMQGLVASTENLGGDMPAAILFNGYATVYICIYIYI